MKAVYITPIVKKADMDPTDTKSYRPISNLSVLSKLLERLVCKQLVTYLPTPPLFGLKFVQTLVHCCSWLFTETQCKIISVQQN